MIWHVFGWTTIAAQAICAVGATRWLWTTGQRPWSWQQPPAVPELQGQLNLGFGSSDVGLV